MVWNWLLPDWPNFTYDASPLGQKEREFLLGAGSSFAYLKEVSEEERNQFAIEVLSIEGLKSSRIEGEILERNSLQSSIRKHFGLDTVVNSKHGKERGMAELLCAVYETFDKPLTHEMLWEWHTMLFQGDHRDFECGKYRTHSEPMQIVSNRLDSSNIFFEAPPSDKISHEMTVFIDWFNSTRFSEPILGRAAIAHVYFESIHPFEDGNGRIGRVLVEKVLSQGVGKPVLIAISKYIEEQKKTYYSELGRCNQTLEIPHWVDFFSDVILHAQKDSMRLLHFLIIKSRMLTSLAGQINSRQEKVLLRIFAEGPDGFAGGVSADKYIAVTKASRATATRDLADLVQKAVLIRTGELRHTRYWLNLNSAVEDSKSTLSFEP